ncbi:MAG: hypothetical protein ACFFCS_23210, partial [Candidatus Hodarchaeota archaeon]
MDLQEFAFQLYNYFKTQMENAFEQTIYYGLLGRVLFIISYIIYTSFMNNSLKTRERFFWVKFIVKEAGIALLCLLNMTLTFFILAYSVVMSGAMLNAVWKKAENIHSKRAARTFNILFRIIIPILGISGFTLFLLLGDHLLYELIGVSAGIGVATISGLRYNKVNTFEAQLALRKSNIWNKSKVNKVVIILAIIMMQTIFYGIIYTQVFSFTWVFMVPMRDG